jgi:DNA-binding MarR family transcriptional regulator
VINFYQTLKNRDAEKISVYALNYGLCSREDIRYGEPQTSDNQGKYYQEWCFNYSDLVRDTQNTVEFIECASCSSKFDVADEEMYRVYSFACPNCRTPASLKKRRMLSAEDRLEIEDVSSLLDPLEYEFLRALFLAEKVNLRAKEIAEEIDVSSALAGKVGTRLAEKGLVSRTGGKGTRLYSLTPEAQRRFFEAGSAIT